METHSALKKSLDYFNQEAARYDRAESGSHARNLQKPVLRALSGQRWDSVLDIGCGTGTLLSRLATEPGVRLAGLDLSPAMLARAREKLGDQADLRQGEAASLPWPEASFDLVTCVDSFHHYPDAMAVLTGMARVCRPGGILLIADLWFPQPLRSLANHFLPLGKNGDVRIRSGMEMGRLVKTAGFTVRAWHLLSLDSALLVAARE